MCHLIISYALEEKEASKQKHFGTFILVGEELKCTQDKTTTFYGIPLFLRLQEEELQYRTMFHFESYIKCSVKIKTKAGDT